MQQTEPKQPRKKSATGHMWNVDCYKKAAEDWVKTCIKQDDQRYAGRTNQLVFDKCMQQSQVDFKKVRVPSITTLDIEEIQNVYGKGAVSFTCVVCDQILESVEECRMLTCTSFIVNLKMICCETCFLIGYSP